MQKGRRHAALSRFRFRTLVSESHFLILVRVNESTDHWGNYFRVLLEAMVIRILVQSVHPIWKADRIRVSAQEPEVLHRNKSFAKVFVVNRTTLNHHPQDFSPGLSGKLAAVEVNSGGCN